MRMLVGGNGAMIGATVHLHCMAAVHHGVAAHGAVTYSMQRTRVSRGRLESDHREPDRKQQSAKALRPVTMHE
jgi:hypothetical protein